MPDTPTGDWLACCRDEGIDPGEVRRVLGRYQAYRRFYRQGRGAEGLPLETWFQWYRIETASESAQHSPAPSGCSVGDDAEGAAAIRRPEAFLRVLVLAAAEPDL